MILHHLRNASLIIEHGAHFILVDPMLSKAASQSPFTLFRFKPRKNPLVELPPQAEAILAKVSHCLITHKHPDHLDKVAEQFLKDRAIPTLCSVKDETYFKRRGLPIEQTLPYGIAQEYLGGHIMGTPARHGYGFIAGPMGNVMGFYLELPGAPSLYISSDTIYTDDVAKILKEKKPDICVVACGSAQLDLGKPLLMTLDDIVRFVRDSPKHVLANHMEALNHCPTTRSQLKERLHQEGLLDKVFVPEDGESKEYLAD